MVQSPSSEYLITQATHDDKQNWGGFCEIESEPALFNALLRDFGVQGVQVREVISLDDETLSTMPTPVYGMVMLFKWYQDEGDEQQEQSCPEDVWFANQTVNNACASVALLNIVNNIPDVELGENLHAFREFTHTFNPADKGDAVANFEFVRRIHNSFSRKIDIQNADLSLSNEVKRRRNEVKKSRNDPDETGFHFVAFMPIEGRLWKLDGLERQPLCLGKSSAVAIHPNSNSRTGPVNSDEWLMKTKPGLEARMLQCAEDQLGFALLSLVGDPMIAFTRELVSNVLALNAIDDQLGKLHPGWQHQGFLDDDVDHISSLQGLTGLVSEYDLQKSLRTSFIPSYASVNDVKTLLERRRELMNVQATLRLDMRECRQDNEESQAAARRHDSGTRVQGFAKLVEQKRKADRRIPGNP